MYSIVLATMLATSSTTPAFGWGCHGCHGCYSCSGCYGCYGYGCGGCWCCGGCYGCYGCCGGCFGCYGCTGCYGYGYSYAVPVYYYPAPVVRVAEAATAPAEAKVIVNVPEDAALYIDGQKSKMTSDRRTFVSPVLQPGATYYYDLKAEVVRDGEKKTETRRVTLRAGQVARVDFRDVGQGEEPVATATEAPATVTVRMPAKARLLIDGKATPMTSNVRTFETPKLSVGKQYYYTLTAEFDRDGETLSQSRRVIVEAGKKVSVSFEQPKPATADIATK